MQLFGIFRVTLAGYFWKYFRVPEIENLINPNPKSFKFSLTGQMNFGSDEFSKFSRLEQILIIFSDLVTVR